MNDNNAEFIATAHNLNDNVESFFIRASRGTGLKGLKGMEHIDPPYVKPLLHFSKDEIQDYASKYKVPYVNDESNLTSDYLRNTIRNIVLPAIESHQSNVTERVNRTINNLNKDHVLLEEIMMTLSDKYIVKDGSKVKIDLRKMEKYEHMSTLLYHFLKDYGVNEEQVDQLISSSTGSIFSIGGYLLNKDRNSIIIEKEKPPIYISISIEAEGIYDISEQGCLEISKKKDHLSLRSEGGIVVGMEKTKFPLILRSWNPGDKFCPAGMDGMSKKVSKFLKDLKVPQIEKSDVFVLIANDGNICGIPGFRSDHRYLPSKGEKVYHIKLIKKPN